MSAPGESTLRVPGATLFYKVKGSGPLLLLLQGGDGDADGMSALADKLAPHYTVVTCDRRGLSRSKLDDPAEAMRVETHSEDAHLLLGALTDEPALVFGLSLGALIGLELVARYPEQVRLLVAHEPPATELLPDAERATAEGVRDDIEATFRREGLPAAMRKFLAIAGVNVEKREAEYEPPAPSPQRGQNLLFFLTRDAPAVRRFRLDIEGLQAVSAKVVLGAGEASRASFPHHCARALALRLGKEAVLFPGDHGGPALQPRAFAARLREVLGDSQAAR